jgi:hypothetical protein
MNQDYIPGGGCLYHAHSEEECGCDVDWTPREVYELREQRDRLAEAMRHFMSDTPETDAEHAQFPMGGFTLDFARKLERERDKLAEELEEAQNAIEMMLRDSSCRRIPAYTEEQLAAVEGGSDDH